MSEFELIRWLRQNTPTAPQVLVGPGDDTAVIDWPARGPLLITTDVLTDGEDFVLAEIDPRRAGRKAMAANLSDIAAMAGNPLAAVVGLVLPRKSGRALAEPLYLGLRDMADRFQTPIVGGDTNSWDGPLVVNVTVIGEAVGRGAVTRAGARPGDWLMVTGPLGGSILGHHLDFTPRLREAELLHRRVHLYAMIDISDGLAADVNHLCEESHCGALLVAEAVPISEDARRMTDKRSPLDHALSDGEDFELAFAVSPGDGATLLRDPPFAGLAKIGEFVASGLWIEERGTRRELPPRGWVHEFS